MCFPSSAEFLSCHRKSSFPDGRSIGHVPLDLSMCTDCAKTPVRTGAGAPSTKDEEPLCRLAAGQRQVEASLGRARVPLLVRESNEALFEQEQRDTDGWHRPPSANFRAARKSGLKSGPGCCAVTSCAAQNPGPPRIQTQPCLFSWSAERARSPLNLFMTSFPPRPK